MTKEEIVTALLDDMEMPYLQDWQARDIVDFVLKKYTEGLPSNLDEAANNYCIDIRLGYPRVMDETDKYIYNAFKAGAEWMAGQGWSRELEVKEDAGGYPYIDKHIELYDYDTDEPLAKQGDKVVAQIRKK